MESNEIILNLKSIRKKWYNRSRGNTMYQWTSLNKLQEQVYVISIAVIKPPEALGKRVRRLYGFYFKTPTLSNEAIGFICGTSVVHDMKHKLQAKTIIATFRHALQYAHYHVSEISNISGSIRKFQFLKYQPHQYEFIENCSTTITNITTEFDYILTYNIEGNWEIINEHQLKHYLQGIK